MPDYMIRLEESLNSSEVLRLINKFEYAFSVIEINLRALVFLIVIIMIFSLIALVKIYR